MEVILHCVSERDIGQDSVLFLALSIQKASGEPNNWGIILYLFPHVRPHIIREGINKPA